MNRAILREMLAEDFDVLEAEDGRQCLAQLETYGADISLVLLDMVMPELDGLQVLEEMNKRGLSRISRSLSSRQTAQKKRCGRPTTWAWRTT